MGTWSFRARLGGNYARTCARGPPLAPGSGSGLGLGSGSGSLPGLVLFESGLTLWVASIPALLPEPNLLRYPNPNRPANGCLKTVYAVGRLDRTAATVQTEPLQLLNDLGPFCPSRSAINSAPVSHSQTHQNENLFSLSAF